MFSLEENPLLVQILLSELEHWLGWIFHSDQLTIGDGMVVVTDVGRSEY